MAAKPRATYRCTACGTQWAAKPGPTWCPRCNNPPPYEVPGMGLVGLVQPYCVWTNFEEAFAK